MNTERQSDGFYIAPGSPWRPRCRARCPVRGSQVCDRDSGHLTPHVAHAGKKMIAVWNDFGTAYVLEVDAWIQFRLLGADWVRFVRRENEWVPLPSNVKSRVEDNREVLKRYG